MSTPRKTRLCDHMTTSLDDKLFFLEHVPDRFILLDYGCADARVMCELQRRGYDLPMVGVERCAHMRSLAEENIQSLYDERGLGVGEIEVRDNWRWAADYVRDVSFMLDAPIVLLASSVLHEVKSEHGNLRPFHSLVDFVEPDYIVARDMQKVGGHANYAVDEAERTRIFTECAQLHGHELVSMYFDLHGRPCTVRELYHMMMHFRYVQREDVRQEIEEDYFALSPSDVEKAAGPGYEQLLYQPFQIPELTSKLQRMFGIELPAFNTHAKHIYRSL